MIDLRALSPLLLNGPLNAQSRRWSTLVNGVAASPMLKEEVRLALLRRAGLRISDARVGPRCYFHTAQISIGDRAILNHGCHIENVAPVHIGDGAGLGIGVMVLTSTHAINGREERAGEWSWHPVSIGAGCWLGARTTVLAGVDIGAGCVIAAGSLVREDCEPDGVYAGVPARRIRDLE